MIKKGNNDMTMKPKSAKRPKTELSPQSKSKIIGQCVICHQDITLGQIVRDSRLRVTEGKAVQFSGKGYACLCHHGVAENWKASQLGLAK